MEKKSLAPAKIPQEKIDVAKERYMNYDTIKGIAEDLGLNRRSLQYYVDKYWKSERALRKDEMVRDFAESKIAIINDTFSNAYRGVHAWVHKVTRSAYELRPHEVKTLMDVIGEMDKIIRLDAGKPTDIISDVAPVSIVEIRKKILESDPFLEEGEYREISDIDSKE